MGVTDSGVLFWVCYISLEHVALAREVPTDL